MRKIHYLIINELNWQRMLNFIENSSKRIKIYGQNCFGDHIRILQTF